MSGDDVHTPTDAGPGPDKSPTFEAPAGKSPTFAAPAGAGLLSAGPPVEATAGRPEVAVGAAFAGGFVAALILRRLGG